MELLLPHSFNPLLHQRIGGWAAGQVDLELADQICVAFDECCHGRSMVENAVSQ